MSTATSKPLNPRAITFGRQLRAEMLDQAVSTRELGRRLARPGLTATAARRTIMKYLRGEVLPSVARRNELADALGIGRDRLNVDEDDEEADLFMTLYQAMQAIARHEAVLAIARDRAPA